MAHGSSGSRRRTNTATRTIQFFRVDAGQDDSGCPLPFPHRQHLNIIGNLVWSGQMPTSNYLRYDADSDLCAHVLGTDELLFGLVRRGALPLLERAGQLSPLMISDDQGLLETIHVVWFGNNIVGADYNHFGPGMSRLSSYFEQKCGLSAGSVHFNPLLKQDSLGKFNRLRDIRLFDLKIRSSYASVVEQVDPALGQAFEAARGLVADTGTELEVVIAPKGQDRLGLRERLSRSIAALARRPDLRTGVERFQIRGTDEETNRVEPVDLLSDRLITKRPIVRSDSRTRALDPGSAFQAIRSAYDELRPELEVAAEVVVNEENRHLR